MANLGPEHVEHLLRTRESLRDKFKRFKQRMNLDNHVEKAVRTVEVGVGAAAAGLVQGRSGPQGLSILGIPVEVLGGVALNVAGHVGAAGKHSDHLCNFGDGLIAAFTSSFGFGVGKTWRDTGHLFGNRPQQQIGPGAPAHTAGHVSPQVMADIAARMGMGG